MPIFYHTAEKQCFQSLQCGAVYSRMLSKTQGRAGGRLQHPKWYFQRFRALNTIRSTMRHGSGPSDYFAVYVYRPAKPRVPWISEIPEIGIVGFVSLSCTPRSGRISRWRIERRRRCTGRDRGRARDAVRFRRHGSGDHRGWAQRKTPQAWLDPRSQVPGGTPSAGLSLGWMLASRANLRFTRRDGDTASEPRTQEQSKVAGQEGWQKCS